MANSEEITEKTSTRQSTKVLWLIIIWMIAAGIVFVITLSVQFVPEKKILSYSDTLQVIGASLLIAGASFTSGGLVGFLFGIPKVVQDDNPSKDQNSPHKISIVQNDNLVQISDWLTKIIVGVGLTQLYKIPSFLGRIGRDFSPVFGNDDASGKGAIICILLYFLTLGFFAVYLWTRLFFVRLLKSLNDQLQRELEVTKAKLDQVKDDLEKTTQQNLSQSKTTDI